MTEYNKLIKLVKKYNEEALRIFNKLQKADQEAKATILDYEYYGNFERIDWDFSYENSISVRYGYDLYSTSILRIPVNILFDDAKIDKWIKSKIDEAMEEKERKRQAEEKYQEEKERQEYERLKKKWKVV